MYFFFFWGFKRKIFSRVIQLQNSISKPTLQIKIKKTVKKPPPFNQSRCEIHGKLPKFLVKETIAADLASTWNSWQMSLASWLTPQNIHIVFSFWTEQSKSLEVCDFVNLCWGAVGGCCLFCFFSPFFFSSFRKYQKTTNILICVTAIKSAESCLETSWLL